MEIETMKKVINVSSSVLDKKIYRTFTLKQLLFTIISFLIMLALGIVIIVFINTIAGIILMIILCLLIILSNIKQCILLKSFTYFFKYIFQSKRFFINTLPGDNGLVVTKNKKYLFFEINCEPMIGNEQVIFMKIQDYVDSISQLVNWSIINVNLPYSNLAKNKIYIEKLINEYIKNNKIVDDDPILKNLLANHILTSEFINGQNNKNTYLLCLELNKEINVKVALEQVENINKNLQYQNFKINAVSNQTFEFIKKQLLFFEKEISVHANYIKSNDEYFHFIKIDNLPTFIDYAYLDFLNDLSNEDYDVSFSINTYSIKNIKKEEKLWENAMRFAESELNRAFKYKDQIESQNNYDAVMELTSDLVSNKYSTQKYELIICVKTDKVNKIYDAKRRIKNILKKQYKYDLCYSKFNQLELLNNFQRNLLKSKTRNRSLKILPNNLIAYSYPFMGGNTYLNKGLYLGELFNKNPLYFSLNAGKKENNSALIVGSTGSGKSTFIKFIVKNNMSEQNVTTILIDPKGEYSTDANILKMKPLIINLDNTNDLVLNPFELSKYETRESKVESILNFIKIWFEKNWNLEINNILIKAIEEMIDKLEFSIEHLYKILKKSLSKDNKVHNLILSTISNLLPNGVYNYFTKKCKYDFNSKLIIFNISSILSNYSNINKVKLTLLFKFLKIFIYNKSNLDDDNEKKTQVIVDEFPAIANPTAPFVITEFVSLIRLVRSYDTSLILAMQDMVRLQSMDVESNESLKSVANNTKHKFIMKLNDEQLKIMYNIWGDSVELSSTETKEITMKFSKGDILYLSDASRFYFNATDPTSIHSYLSWDLNKKIEDEISTLKQNKNTNFINNEFQKCNYELVVVNNDINDNRLLKVKKIHTTQLDNSDIILLKHNEDIKQISYTPKPIRTINIDYKQRKIFLLNELEKEKKKLRKYKSKLSRMSFKTNKNKKWISDCVLEDK